MTVKDRQSKRKANDEHVSHEEEHPRGTLTLLMIYLVVLMTFWGYIYTLLLLRG